MNKIKQSVLAAPLIILTIFIIGVATYYRDQWQNIVVVDSLMITGLLVAVIMPSILFVPVVLPKVGRREKIIVYPLCIGLSAMALWGATFAAVMLNTGALYSYQEKIHSVSVIKPGRAGGGNPCTYTARWWDKHIREYHFACTGKNIEEHVRNGGIAIATVDAATYLDGKISLLKKVTIAAQ